MSLVRSLKDRSRWAVSRLVPCNRCIVYAAVSHRAPALQPNIAPCHYLVGLGFKASATCLVPVDRSCFVVQL